MAPSSKFPRRLPVTLAALLVASLFTLAPAAAHPAFARDPEGRILPPTTALPVSAITPGTVNRTSLKLSASYAVTLALRYGSRAFSVDSTATITNNSGGPIDRIELNTIAARLGGMTLRFVEVDGVGVARTVDDQTIIVRLGGVLAAGATVRVRVKYHATLRSSLAGSNWLFTRVNGIVDAYRWIPWVSRETPFDRPNHGDPFVTPISPLVKLRVVTDRKLRFAVNATRTSVSADGLTQTFEAKNVRDVTITAAPDFHTRTTYVGSIQVRYYYRSAANAATILDAAADAIRAYQSRVGPYPYTTFKVAQSAGGYGMESPGLIWIPYGIGSANLRYLISHETAHQWFYSLVGNDQARQPFADEATADFLAREITGTRRGSRCSTALLDRYIYSYSSACYYEIVYIQGGNLLNEARRRMGSTAFWAAIKKYVAANKFGLTSTSTLLQTLDNGTSVDLSKLFRPRFPRFY
jgi:aminopeptidase N